MSFSRCREGRCAGAATTQVHAGREEEAEGGFIFFLEGREEAQVSNTVSLFPTRIRKRRMPVLRGKYSFPVVVRTLSSY